MKKIYLWLILGGLFLLVSACNAPQAAPSLPGEELTAESQNASGNPTTQGGSPAPTLPEEITVVPTDTPAVKTPAVNIPASEVPATPADVLKPPDSDLPAAGICTDPPEGGTVKMTIRADVPDPRCAKAYPDQQLVLVNGTDLPVKIKLGSMRAVIHPGEEKQLEKPLGEYLHLGVHFIDVTQPGFAGELWLVEK